MTQPGENLPSADFPAVTEDEWRAAAEKAGRRPWEKLGVTIESGLRLDPLYPTQDAPADLIPPPSGEQASSWMIVQEHALDEVAPERILEDLEGGVEGVVVRAPASHMVDAVPALLSKIDLAKVHVSVECTDRFLPGVVLPRFWKRKNIPADQARGCLCCDPLGAAARWGASAGSLEAALNLVAPVYQWASELSSRVQPLRIDTSPYHEAGASAVEDLALGLATATEYLRRLHTAEVDLHDFADRTILVLNATSDLFENISKFRAARLLWARLLEVIEVPESQRSLRLEAHLGARATTRYAPWINVLRGTVACIAAACGGAQRVTVRAYDDAEGAPSARGRRLARNTQLILRDESHLGAVWDPAAGSEYVEQRTADLAQKAWELFQEVERQGGLPLAFLSGWVGERLAKARQTREAAVRTRRQPITGVSEYADLSEEPESTLSAWRQDGTSTPADANSAWLGEESLLQELLTTSPPEWPEKFRGSHSDPAPPTQPGLPQRRLAESFEGLRDLHSPRKNPDAVRPRVFLASLGTVADHSARTEFARLFFRAGGYDVESSLGFETVDRAKSAFKYSMAPTAVICSSDELYQAHGKELARSLRAAGAQRVYIASPPDPELEDPAIDDFIHRKTDAIEILKP